MCSVDSILVVQMGTRRESAASHIADHVALIHARAGACVAEPREMPVQRSDVAAMLQNDCVAVPALNAAEQNFAVARCADWSARRSGVVDAAMGPNRVQHRMASARVEIGAYASEVQRCANEGFANASAFRSVVPSATRAVAETCSAKRLALVHELRRDNLAVAQLHSVAPKLFVDDGERVSLADVLN